MSKKLFEIKVEKQKPRGVMPPPTKVILPEKGKGSYDRKKLERIR